MSYRTECMELAAVLAVECKVQPTVAVRMAQALLRDAAGIQRHCVNACNREVTPQETARCRHAESRIRRLLESYDVGVSLNGDPRGYCVKLHFASGRYNTWGGAESGYGVPVGRM